MRSENRTKQKQKKKKKEEEKNGEEEEEEEEEEKSYCIQSVSCIYMSLSRARACTAIPIAIPDIVESENQVN